MRNAALASFAKQYTLIRLDLYQLSPFRKGRVRRILYIPLVHRSVFFSLSREFLNIGGNQSAQSSRQWCTEYKYVFKNNYRCSQFPDRDSNKISLLSSIYIDNLATSRNATGTSLPLQSTLVFLRHLTRRRSFRQPASGCTQGIFTIRNVDLDLIYISIHQPLRCHQLVKDTSHSVHRHNSPKVRRIHRHTAGSIMLPNPSS